MPADTLDVHDQVDRQGDGLAGGVMRETGEQVAATPTASVSRFARSFVRVPVSTSSCDV